MTYKEYIKAHLKDIENSNRSYPPLSNYGRTRARLEELASKSDTLSKAIEYIREKQDVKRDDIIQLFREGKLMTGFWVTLLWGNLSVRNLGHAVEDELRTVRKEGKPQCSVTPLLIRLEKVDRLLEQGKTEEAFISLYDEGLNKIKGLGISFFTKLLYFMGKQYNLSPMPLIYDKWTRGIDAALIAEGVLPESDNYKLSFRARGGFDLPEFPPTTPPSRMYMNYIQRMSNLAKEIGGEVSPDKFEEYLFGMSQVDRARWNPTDNPRYVLQMYYLRPLFDMGKVRQSRRAADADTGIILLEKGQTIRGRKVEFGYEFQFEEKRYYLFSGKKASYSYCLLLTKKQSDPILDFSRIVDLRGRGYDNEGKDYIFIKFGPKELSLATEEVKHIAKLLFLSLEKNQE